MNKLWHSCMAIVALCCAAFTGTAQEAVAPLGFNPALQTAEATRPRAAAKATAISLPFFEDFTGYDLYPDASRWIQSRQVYVNNTMCVDPVARGVATFDALGANGRPYDTTNLFALLYADSLTSQPFDMTVNAPGDSIYLSFFYQPQGLGFSPETTDSLILYFLDSSSRWVKQWSVPGTTLQPFRQVMIPVRDGQYFYNGFQFRFVNKASINLNDDVWNLDYIRMSVGRNRFDTVVNDPAWSRQPLSYLRDYTAMPYRQFLAAAQNERAQQLTAYNRIYSGTPQSLRVGYNARVQSSGAVLGNAGPNTVTVPNQNVQTVTFPTFTSTPSAAPGDAVIFNTDYYLERAPASTPDANDTLRQQTIFSNYLAYDDGTAEKSYYLNLSPSLPGKIAIEYRLNAPDTLRGVSILFGQQVPSAANKFFSVLIYKTIAGVNGGTSDQVLLQRDFFQPRFIDSVNRFYVYTFESGLVLPAGTFYLGVLQPALSGSDSLYYALDANRVGGNHLYYNVLNTWQSSTISGALMVRPLLGAPVIGSGVAGVDILANDWNVFPNPGSGAVAVSGMPRGAVLEVRDISGRLLLQTEEDRFDASLLSSGVYLLRWQDGNIRSTVRRWVKL